MNIIQKNPHKRRIVIASSILLAVAIGASVFAFINKDDAAISQPQSANSETKGEATGSTDQPQPSDTTAPSAGPAPANDNDKTATDPGSNATLLAPNGEFVSAHRVQLNSKLSSVCNTTPGASCRINFTNGGTVKSLPTETADRGGSAYWDNVVPKDIGLTAGTWKVQAVAQLNGEIKTTDDAMEMVVSQ